MTIDDDHHGLVPVRSGAAGSFPLLSHMCANFSLSSLSSYPHPISPFLAFACHRQPPSHPTPSNLSHVNIHAPIRSSSSSIHCSISFSPPPPPHISHAVIFLSPSPSQPGTFFSTPTHDQKRCTKSNFTFSSQASTQRTQRKQASPAWTIYVFIPPGGIYLAQTKEGYWCLLEEEEKGVAI